MDIVADEVLLEGDVAESPVTKTLSDIQTYLLTCFSREDIEHHMQTIKALLFDAPDTNLAKIQFFKEELTAGRYDIDSRRIAEKILEFTATKKVPETA